MLQFYFENDWFSLKETTLQRAFHIHDGRAPTTSYVAACSCFCVYTDFSEIATFFVDSGSNIISRGFFLVMVRNHENNIKLLNETFV